MTTTAEREETREARLKDAHKRLDAAVLAIKTSADWIAWLKQASRFHKYSANNASREEDSCRSRPRAGEDRMMTTEEKYRSGLPFTVHMSVVLEEIVHAAQRRDIVSRAVGDDPLSIRVYTGIAVSIGDLQGNPQPNTDIRDLYLRVIHIDGDLEQYWRISALMADVASGRFACGLPVVKP